MDLVWLDREDTSSVVGGAGTRLEFFVLLRMTASFDEIVMGALGARIPFPTMGGVHTMQTMGQTLSVVSFTVAWFACAPQASPYAGAPCDSKVLFIFLFIFWFFLAKNVYRHWSAG